jgi:hypothetical protein
MLKHILLFLTLTNLTFQSCAKGCLRCNESSECLLCDALKFLKLNSTSKACETVDLANCQLMDIQGQCVTCATNYYLQSGKCVQVPTEKLTANPQCSMWASASTCVACNKDYLITGASCVAVTSPIANCGSYTSQTACGTCNSGFQRNANGTACDALPNISQCNTYSTHQCRQCAAGFILNKNLYYTQYDDLASEDTLQGALGLMHAQLSGQKQLFEQTTCQSVTVENCSVLVDFNKCQTCNPTHYLTQDKKCLLNPETIIEHCEIYSSNTACQQCEQGYYVSSGNCKAVTSISDCARYSQTATSVQCVECVSTHYLQSSSQCSPRNNPSIANCATLNVQFDNCMACQSNFMGIGTQANRYTSCITGIANCAEYPFTGNEATCNKCADGFYSGDAEGKSCDQGPASENCAVYLSTKGLKECQICENKFYLKDKVCTAQADIANCDLYSQNTKDQCAQCTSANFMFKIAQKCTDGKTAVDNCKTYSESDTSTNTCEACQDTYLKVDNTCVSKATELPGCLTFQSATSCASCEANKGLQQTQADGAETCGSPLSYVSTNCAADRLVGSRVTQMKCESCAQNSMLYDLSHQSMCVERNRLNVLGDHSLVSNEATDKCAVYYSDGKCKLCSGVYKLHISAGGDHTCINTTCDRGLIAIQYDSDEEEFLQNRCRGDAEADQLAELYSLNYSFQSLVRVKCTAAATPIVVKDFDDNFAYIDTTQSIGSNWLANLHHVAPALSCTQFSASDHTQGGQTVTELNPNCKYFTFADDDYKCVRCETGRTGKGENGTLECDTNITNCNTNNFLFNIPNVFARHSSCDWCNAGQVPLLYNHLQIQDDEVIAFNGFKVGDVTVNTFLANGSSDNTVQKCVTNSQTGLKTELNLDEDVPAGQLVANCGLYVVDLGVARVEDSSSFSLGTAGLRCGYCLPGYAPTGDALAITACTAIPNCKSSQHANACGECDSGYAFKYTNAGQLDTSVCVKDTEDSVEENVPENCFAFNVDDFECEFCEKGFFMNRDKECVQITVPGCSQANWVIPYTSTTGLADKAFALYAHLGLKGCNACTDNGFVGVFNDFSGDDVLTRDVCVQTTYFNTHTLPTDTKYVPHCVLYDGQTISDSSTPVKCSQCQANYVLSQDKETCHAQASSPNCAEFRNDDKGCARCSSDGQFGIAKNAQGNYFCQTHDDANCLEVEKEDNETSNSVCAMCSPNYYLSADPKQCVLGNVPNCKVLSGANTCTTCLDTFVLINGLKGHGETNQAISYCYPLPADLKCASASVSIQNNLAQIKCDSCAAAHEFPHAVADDQLDNACYPYSTIDNCAEYSVDGVSLSTEIGDLQEIDKSNFECTRCNSGFYITRSGYACTAREHKPAQCNEYTLDAEECIGCNDGYFLEGTGVNSKCVVYPSGETGCTGWSAEDGTRTCTQCDGSKYFMSSGVCTAATAPDANCVQVSGLTSCSKCAANFYLDQTANEGTGNDYSCVSSSISNCAQLEAADSCALCNPGYKRELNTTTNKATCVNLNNPSCTQWNGLVCEKCNVDQYPDPTDSTVVGKCKAVTNTNKISQCQEYSSATNCSRCAQGYSLSSDGLNCASNVSVVYQNCFDNFTPSAKICSRCNPGYFFNDSGACTAFTGTLSYSSGCFLVDDDNCGLCRSGYHMNEKFECVDDDP